MCFQLSSISKGITKPIFCIKYRSNEEKFAEMVLWKINVRSFYLGCTTKGCKARLTIQIRPPILVEVVDGKNRLASSVTEEILLSTTNYGPIKHNCNRACFSTKEDDGLCRITRHLESCWKSAPTGLKVRT